MRPVEVKAGQKEDSFHSVQQQGFLNKVSESESEKLHSGFGQTSVWYKQEAEELGENPLSSSVGIREGPVSV